MHRILNSIFLEATMRRSILIATAALASGLTLGCDDQPAPSEPPTHLPPSFRTAQSESSGARVFRFDDVFFWVIVDAERGLTTVLGATPEEHVAACQSGLIPEEASYQDVVRPGGVTKRQVKGAEMGVTIWAAASFDICGELSAFPFFAAGTARVRYVDNDAFGSQTRGNAFGVRAHGTVTILATGEERNLLAKYQAVFFRSGEVRESSSDIILR
jgi:hypothetical protein